MAIPKDKEELLNAIIDNYKKLTTELSTIPTELTTIKELEGHSKNTLMSVNDLVAYLVGLNLQQKTGQKVKRHF